MSLRFPPPRARRAPV